MAAAIIDSVSILFFFALEIVDRSEPIRGSRARPLINLNKVEMVRYFYDIDGQKMERKQSEEQSEKKRITAIRFGRRGKPDGPDGQQKKKQQQNEPKKKENDDEDRIGN